MILTMYVRIHFSIFPRYVVDADCPYLLIEESEYMVLADVYHLYKMKNAYN